MACVKACASAADVVDRLNQSLRSPTRDRNWDPVKLTGPDDVSATTVTTRPPSAPRPFRWVTRRPVRPLTLRSAASSLELSVTDHEWHGFPAYASPRSSTA